MKEKWTPHIIAVNALIVFIVLGLACASAPESSDEIIEVTPRDLRKYAYENGYNGQKFVTEARIRSHYHQYGFGGVYLDDLFFPVNNVKEDLLGERLEEGKSYRVYLTKIETSSEVSFAFRIDRIDGLISVEEAQARIDKRNAEEKTAKEAQRQKQEAEHQAREAANRYDPAKFIIVPSDFKPADYTKADLFAAVAASEKLGIIEQGWFNTVYTPSKDFVSDVVFVSQDGTNITFRTEDNAIRKRMKVGSRTGLAVDQRVRIYYTVYRVDDWTIDAIERL
jgi:hypothetical protein